MSDRDPRVDPKAGDVLRGEGATRTVTNSGGTPYGLAVAYDGSYGRNVVMLWLWREWARNAEILEQAP